MMKRKYLSLILAVATILGTCLSGCGEEQKETQKADTVEANESEQKESNSETEEKQETVTIKWYRRTAKVNEDERKVEEAINEYIEPLIGVKVDVCTNQETKLDLSLAAGEDIDVFWVANWSNGPGLIASNCAYDITDVVTQYEGLYNSIPENIWEAAKIDGANYYIPIYKEAASGCSLSVPTAMVEKYGWDLSTVKSLEDITPFLADVYADGIDHPMSGKDWEYKATYGLKDFAFVDAFGGIALNGDTTKIVNIVESEEYAEYIELWYEWNQAGYVNQDEASTDHTFTTLLEGNDGAFAVWVNTPDGQANCSLRYGIDMTLIPLTDNYITSDSPFGSAYMINQKTEKIDAVMKFMELLATDETLANLAAYGIEGDHYELTAEGRVKLIADSGYTSAGVWAVCSALAPTLQEGESADKKEQYIAFNESAKTSLLAGFNFDKTDVSAEEAALNAVYNEYNQLLEEGFYDPEEFLPQYQKALKDAGIDAYLAEMQKQYDAWIQ